MRRIIKNPHNFTQLQIIFSEAIVLYLLVKVRNISVANTYSNCTFDFVNEISAININYLIIPTLEQLGTRVYYCVLILFICTSN